MSRNIHFSNDGHEYVSKWIGRKGEKISTIQTRKAFYLFGPVRKIKENLKPTEHLKLVEEILLVFLNKLKAY